jgi:hypothetical protein
MSGTPVPRIKSCSERVLSADDSEVNGPSPRLVIAVASIETSTSDVLPPSGPKRTTAQRRRGGMVKADKLQPTEPPPIRENARPKHTASRNVRRADSLHRCGTDRPADQRFLKPSTTAGVTAR